MSEVIDGLCYSCREQMDYQLLGVSDGGQAFIQTYQQLGMPIIHCDLCTRKVRYEKKDDRWHEVDMPEE